MSPALTTHIQPNLTLNRRKPTLESRYHTRRDPRRMPIHAHDSAEALKPEWMCQAPQQLIPTVVKEDCLHDDAPQGCHARNQPRWYVTTVQWQVGATSSIRHDRQYRSAQRRSGRADHSLGEAGQHRHMQAGVL